jgi:hypothetical protein
VGRVPGVEDPTLIVLLDEDRAFPAGFTFRHAVEFLYSGRALGVVPGAHPLLYALRLEPQAVAIEPWPVIQRPWNEPPQRFELAQVIVVLRRGGALTLLPTWPSPPLPGTGAAYDPEARIRPGPIPRRAEALSAAARP